MKREAIAGLLGLVLGAAGMYFGVPKPATDKVVEVVVDKVSPAPLVAPRPAPPGWGNPPPGVERGDWFKAPSVASPPRCPSAAVDAAYLRHLHQAGLFPVTEHRP